MKLSLTNDKDKTDQIDEIESIPVFGYELLRDILLPELLGKDTPEISYWAGKHLARKFPLLSFDEIGSFFQEAGWGDLVLIEQSRKELKAMLKGPMVARRLSMKSEACFKLEAGFLAEQIQAQKHAITETYDEVLKKQKTVSLTVRWDSKDPAED